MWKSPAKLIMHTRSFGHWPHNVKRIRGPRVQTEKLILTARSVEAISLSCQSTGTRMLGFLIVGPLLDTPPVNFVILFIPHTVSSGCCFSTATVAWTGVFIPTCYVGPDTWKTNKCENFFSTSKLKPGLTYLGNHIQEPCMVPYRPYKYFLYNLAMCAKIDFHIWFLYGFQESVMHICSFFQHLC